MAAERAALLDRIVAKAHLTSRLANLQYIEGEEDLQTVLDAEQSYNDAVNAQVIGWPER